MQSEYRLSISPDRRALKNRSILNWIYCKPRFYFVIKSLFSVFVFMQMQYTHINVTQTIPRNTSNLTPLLKLNGICSQAIHFLQMIIAVSYTLNKLTNSPYELWRERTITTYLPRSFSINNHFYKRFRMKNK